MSIEYKMKKINIFLQFPCVDIIFTAVLSNFSDIKSLDVFNIKFTGITF